MAARDHPLIVEAWAMTPRPPILTWYVPTCLAQLPVGLGSAARRLTADQIVEGWLDRIALNDHHFEDRLAAANFLLNGQDGALRRSLLDNRGNGHLGHRQ